MKKVKIFGFFLVLLLLVIVSTQYPKLTIITGFASKAMVSGVALSGRTTQSLKEQELNVPLIKWAQSTYHQLGDSIWSSAKVWGLQERISVFREGVGGVLLPPDSDGKNISIQRPKRIIHTSLLPYPFGSKAPRDTLFPEINYNILEQAMDAAFDNPQVQKTRSVLILYKDHVIGERYSPGININTRILGWSMTKSILATLYGIRQAQGGLNVFDTVGWPAWNLDERSAITYDDLLRMQSGLEWDENYNDISDVTKMLFLSTDMTLVQPQKKLVAAPESFWNYSSGATNFLSGLLRRDLIDYQEYLDFPYRELIDRIGMQSMLIETDLAGNYVASSYGWATTRDWAKFGLLYLHRGNWNGSQIFDPQWVDYITHPTSNSQGNYGAHFWLNAGGAFPNAPKDMYSANGFQGQYVFIIPSKNLVIVRTGLAESPEFDADHFLKLVSLSIL